MVSHETEAVADQAVFLDNGSQYCQELQAVAAIVVDRLLVVTPGTGVIKRICELEAQRSWHWSVEQEAQ